MYEKELKEFRRAFQGHIKLLLKLTAGGRVQNNRKLRGIERFICLKKN